MSKVTKVEGECSTLVVYSDMCLQKCTQKKAVPGMNRYCPFVSDCQNSGFPEAITF